MKSLIVLNSGNFQQWLDTGRRSLLHEAEHPAPHVLVHSRVYSHTPQTKLYVMMLVHMTHPEGVKNTKKYLIKSSNLDKGSPFPNA